MKIWVPPESPARRICTSVTSRSHKGRARLYKAFNWGVSTTPGAEVPSNALGRYPNLFSPLFGIGGAEYQRRLGV